MITEELAKKCIEIYREKNSLVKSFWYELNAAAIKAVKFPGHVVHCGRLQWLKKGRWLQCRLPSGRLISYYNPKVKAEQTEWGVKDSLSYWGVDSKTKKWREERTYGGKLAENCTQAAARDVMADAMLRLESMGYEVILTVHDEIVTENNEVFGSEREFGSIMSEVPYWAQGLPVKVETFESVRYKK